MDLDSAAQALRRFGLRPLGVIGSGALSTCFRVERDEGVDVVAKIYRYYGYAEHEARALHALRRAVELAAIPEPISVHSADASPDVLVMTLMEGENGRSLADLTGIAAERAADLIAAIVHELRGSIARGFGELDDSPDPSWAAVFMSTIEPYRDVALTDPALSAAAAATIDKAQAILGTDLRPTLIHGDLCLGNLIVGARTIALIDPLDSMWGDPVLDLIHLTKSNGHRLKLLQRFELNDAELDRYWIYMFWRWVSYRERFAVDADEWLAHCAQTVLSRIL